MESLPCRSFLTRSPRDMACESELGCPWMAGGLSRHLGRGSPRRLRARPPARDTTRDPLDARESRSPGFQLPGSGISFPALVRLSFAGSVGTAYCSTWARVSAAVSNVSHSPDGASPSRRSRAIAATSAATFAYRASPSGSRSPTNTTTVARPRRASARRRRARPRSGLRAC